MIGAAPNGKTRRCGWIARLRRAVSYSQLRTALALCVLFTSTFQSFVAQAHIHVPSRAAPDGIYGLSDTLAQPSTAPADNDDRSKRSRGDSSSTCPLCQVLAYSGAPLAHFLVATVAPVLPASIVFIDRAPVTSIAAVSYSWTGRGPPLE